MFRLPQDEQRGRKQTACFHEFGSLPAAASRLVCQTAKGVWGSVTPNRRSGADGVLFPSLLPLRCPLIVADFVRRAASDMQSLSFDRPLRRAVIYLRPQGLPGRSYMMALMVSFVDMAPIR
jgi:hypothetical protein